jgi:hypothetical protein
MATTREKGKIDHAEWPAIIARHTGGETLASIARSYGCTAPAIRYIVNRQARASQADNKTLRSAAAAAAREVAANSGQTASGQQSENVSVSKANAAARNDVIEMPGRPTRSGIDRQLRELVNSDIAVFLVTFDAALLKNSSDNRNALLEATDRLLRAGARTRIALERMALGDADREAFADDGRPTRRKAAGGARHRT